MEFWGKSSAFMKTLTPRDSWYEKVCESYHDIELETKAVSQTAKRSQNNNK